MGNTDDEFEASSAAYAEIEGARACDVNRDSYVNITADGRPKDDGAACVKRRYEPLDVQNQTELAAATGNEYQELRFDSNC